MKNIRISGFSDEIGVSFEQQLQLVTSLGMRYICIRSADRRGIASFTADEVKTELLPKLKAAGVGVSSLGTAVGKIPVDDDAAFAEQLRQMQTLCDICKILDCRYIRAFSFFIPQGTDPDSQKDTVIQKLRELIAIAEKNDVILLHENEKGIYGDTAQRCRTLFDALGCAHFRAAFDFANFVQCDVDPEEAWNLLQPWIEYIHIKDALKLDKQNVVAGSGDGKIEQLLRRAILEEGYEGFLTLEPHLVNFAFFMPGSQKPVIADHLIGKQARNGEEGYIMQYNALKDILSRIQG